MTYGQRSLQGDLISLDALNGGVGDGGLAILEDRGDINRLPSNWCLRRLVSARLTSMEQQEIRDIPWRPRKCP